jgi:hypothetical protein
MTSSPRSRPLPVVLIGLVLVLPCASRSTRADEPSADDFFEKHVRPLLVERCYKCHGAEGKPKGGLRLTARASILNGGDSGPAVIPGKPDDSLLVQAVRYVDEPRMPPNGKLGDSEIATLTRWVALGLPWPNAKPPAQGPATGSFAITDEQRAFWSFQPVRTVVPPPVRDAAWSKNEIDRFILAALEAQGLGPSRPAGKRTLIRRATFDLIGLPPTPEEVDAFLRDETPDAFARVVDRLLASPRYGERWGRHWLDVVRYADSLDSRGSGAPGDILDAWRYRDWVVNALNRDTPYDKFVRDQVAGDVLPPTSPEEGAGGFNRAGTIATTMLAIGNWGNGDADKEKILTDIADDNVDVVSRAFMGLTIACARCHDHKFDPIPTRDYYGLAGIFFSTHILPKLTPKGAGETIIRVPLVSPQEMASRKQHELRLAELEKAVKSVADRYYTEFATERRQDTARYLLALCEYQARPPDQAAVSLDDFARRSGLLPFALRRWSEFLGAGECRLLDRPLRDVGGMAGVAAWTGEGGMASATANSNASAVSILTYRLPPKSIAVHPGPASGAVIRWKSPVAGAVRITGRIADADAAAGDGVAWYIDHRTATGGRELASGDLPNGGAQALTQGKSGDALAFVEVEPGDSLQLVVMPKAEFTCDTTTVDIVITAWAGSASWDLTRDVGSDFLAANPHADRLGNKDAWSFGDTGTTARPAAFAAGADSPLSRWTRAVSSNAPRPDLEQAAREFADSFTFDDVRSPFYIRSAADEAALAPVARAAIAAARSELDAARKATPPAVEYANAAQEGGVPESPHAGTHDVPIHVRGRYDRLAEMVPRHFPIILGGGPDQLITQGSGRAQLASWLTRPEHPLTARVIVNRVWQFHFGEGIVRTPSNFGKLGDRPSHPELLDHLARLFVADGWSLKALHRRIMLSSTYQQSSESSAEALRLDADNRLLSRMNRRRLEAEAIRDNLLAVAGTIDLTMSGPADRDFKLPRRGLYAITVRSDRTTFGSLFDQADSTAPVDRRVVTTVAPQSLFLLNNPFVLDQTRALAGRLLREANESDTARIRRAYSLLYSRPPTEAEERIGRDAVAAARHAGDSVEAAWLAYSHVLVCSNEFLYVD